MTNVPLLCFGVQHKKAIDTLFKAYDIVAEHEDKYKLAAYRHKKRIKQELEKTYSNWALRLELNTMRDRDNKRFYKELIDSVIEFEEKVKNPRYKDLRYTCSRCASTIEEIRDMKF